MKRETTRLLSFLSYNHENKRSKITDVNRTHRVLRSLV